VSFRHDPGGPGGQVDTELGEQGPGQADALAAGLLRVGADAVEPLECLVIDGLDRPMMGRGAGLHDDFRLRLLRQEALELGSRQTLSLDDPPHGVRQRELENGLCDVNADGRSIHLWTPLADHFSGTMMPDHMAGGVHLIS
jgi:hypothetical protein